MNYKGVATLEVIDKKTGKTEKTIEHNRLTDLIDDVFDSNQMDGVINYSADIKRYFNKCVLLDKTPRTKELPDDVHVITYASAVETNTYDEDGLEMIFKFDGKNITSPIECIGLAHDSFQNPEIEKYNASNLITGSYTANIDAEDRTGTFRPFYIDYENNWIYSIETLDFSKYVRLQPFYLYVKKYYHNFNEMCFSSSDVMNMKLVECTEIDLSTMFQGTDSITQYDKPTVFSFDEKNKRVIVSYMIFNNYNIFNTCVFSLDNTSDVQFYNMSFPSYITPKLKYNYSKKLEMTACYHGRLCMMCYVKQDEGDDYYIVGFNPADSTDIELYPIVYVNGTETVQQVNNQLLGVGNDTAYCSGMIIKDGEAYVYKNGYPSGIYYKSKIINITGGTTFTCDYRLSNYLLSTINELTKTLIVPEGKELKITYRITQGRY